MAASRFIAKCLSSQELIPRFGIRRWRGFLIGKILIYSDVRARVESGSTVALVGWREREEFHYIAEALLADGDGLMVCAFLPEETSDSFGSDTASLWGEQVVFAPPIASIDDLDVIEESGPILACDDGEGPGGVEAFERELLETIVLEKSPCTLMTVGQIRGKRLSRSVPALISLSDDAQVNTELAFLSSQAGVRFFAFRKDGSSPLRYALVGLGVEFWRSSIRKESRSLRSSCSRIVDLLSKTGDYLTSGKSAYGPEFGTFTLGNLLNGQKRDVCEWAGRGIRGGPGLVSRPCRRTSRIAFVQSSVLVSNFRKWVRFNGFGLAISRTLSPNS